MAAPSPFFNDSVDIEGDPSYPGTFISRAKDIISHNSVHKYDGSSNINIRATSTSAALFGTRQDLLGLFEVSETSLQDETNDSKRNNPVTSCDPTLLGPVDTTTPPEPPSTTSSAPNSRSSATRSSSNSVRPDDSNSPGASSCLSAANEPPKKRRGRKANVIGNAAEEEEKRSKVLEKNRIAASKCRQKKKQYVSELEETKSGLEHQNSHLQLEYHDLLRLVSQMKNQLISHASCQDPNIDRWVQNEARKFVEGTQTARGPRTTLVDGCLHRPRFSTSSFQLSGLEESRSYTSTSSRQDSLTYSNGKPIPGSDSNAFIV